MTNLLTQHLDTWTTAPNGIKKLRELILELAVRGLLVPQNPDDEPASVLLEKIAAEKARLISEGKIKKSAPLPKIADDEKQFDLPDGWEWARLDDVAEFTNGYAFQSKDFSSEGVGVVKIGDIQNGKIVTTSMSRVDESVVQHLDSSFSIHKGDMLIAMSGATTGKLGFNTTDEVFYLNQRVGKISPHLLDINYFYYPLTTKISENLEKSLGSAIPNLSTAQIKHITFGLPPLAEQHRIVAKVDELMQLCDQLEQKQTSNQEIHAQLVSTLLTTLTQATNPQAFQAAWTRIAANFDSLFTTESSIEQLKQTILQLAVMGKLVEQEAGDEPASVLLEKIAQEKARLISEGKMKKSAPLPKIADEEKPFDLPDGWEWERIGTVFNGGSGSTPLRSSTHYFSNGTENWFKTTDLNLGVVFEGEEKITKQAVQECNLTYYPKNTVCIAMYGGGGTIGKSGILGVTSTINQSVFALPPIEQFNHDFLHLYVKSIRQKWMGFAAGLRKDPNINGLIIKKMLLPIPPLNEQHRIVAKVDELMALCDQLKTKLNTAQTLQTQLAEALVLEAVG